MPQDTTFELDGPVLTLRSATLGAVATIIVSSPGDSAAWVQSGDGFDCSVGDGPATDLSLTVDLQVDGGVRTPRGGTHVVPTVAGDLAARTGQAARAYALGCCALDVAEDQTCVVTDHRLLPLSWTRDAYFVVLPLLLHGEPGSVEEDVVRRHLNWLFGAARAEGPWMRSHLTGGQIKDPGLQADRRASIPCSARRLPAAFWALAFSGPQALAPGHPRRLRRPHHLARERAAGERGEPRR